MAQQRKLRAVGTRCREALVGASPAGASPIATRLLSPDVDVPDVPFDVLVLLLHHLQLSSRLRGACVSKEWRRAALAPSLYTSVDRGLLGDLGRRIPRSCLLCLAERFVTEETERLELSGVRCVDDSLVSQYAQRAINLRVVDLSACAIGDGALAALATHCQRLERLRLWAVDDIGDEGIRALALLGGGALHTVDVRACSELSGAGSLAHLAKACAARLRELRLKGVGDAGDETLYALGAHCPGLTILDASGLRCTDEGVCALAAGCRCLEQLFLAGCKRVSSRGVEAVATHCGAQLRLLDLQGCSTVDDGAACRLAECCSSLETISFQCCPRLTDLGFAALCRSCPLVHITLKACHVSQDAILEAQRMRPRLQVRTIATGPLVTESV